MDKYGRKSACLVYVALEVAINLLEHLNAMHWLMVGRVLGGISTALLCNRRRRFRTRRTRQA